MIHVRVRKVGDPQHRVWCGEGRPSRPPLVPFSRCYSPIRHVGGPVPHSYEVVQVGQVLPRAGDVVEGLCASSSPRRKAWNSRLKSAKMSGAATKPARFVAFAMTSFHWLMSGSPETLGSCVRAHAGGQQAKVLGQVGLRLGAGEELQEVDHRSHLVGVVGDRGVDDEVVAADRRAGVVVRSRSGTGAMTRLEGSSLKASPVRMSAACQGPCRMHMIVPALKPAFMLS